MEQQAPATQANNPGEIDTLAEIDAVGATLLALHDKIDAECNDNYQALGGFNASTTPELDTAYAACEAISEAKRNLQTGLMWLRRAVVKPSGF
jgi:hypothetical protein